MPQDSDTSTRLNQLIMALTIGLSITLGLPHVLADTPTTLPDLSKPVSGDAKRVERIYSTQQVELGKTTFQTHCQSCHGLEGIGEVKEWQKSRADGTFPAPPLNGTAHTWHHNLRVLLGTINRGGIPLGGRMPSFKSILSDDEKFAVLAYVQSLWPDEIYEVWLANNSKS